MRSLESYLLTRSHLKSSCALTLALKHAVDEVTLIEAAIGPLVAATTIFLALVVLSLEFYFASIPRLAAESMLLIVHPFAFIGAAFRVNECASSIGHAIEPLPLVDGAIGLDHAAQPAHLVVAELALVLRAVWPDQDA